jgi:hypothetical protein
MSDSWKSLIDPERPCWADYRSLLDRLPAERFPGLSDLDLLHRGRAVNQRGQAIRFVADEPVSAEAYERQVYADGRVSTRAGSWHDLFNALVWCRLPRLKSAMNALHVAHLPEAAGGRRGPVRDAVTLLDENGLLLVSTDRALSAALAARDWRQAFVGLRERWKSHARVVVCGHALLEKLLRPYKAISGHALLLQVDAAWSGRLGELPLALLDQVLSRRLLTDGVLVSPRALAPLPLMGVPGWEAGQDDDFYADKEVFRPAPPGHVPRPALEIGTDMLPGHDSGHFKPGRGGAQ